MAMHQETLARRACGLHPLTSNLSLPGATSSALLKGWQETATSEA